MKSRTWEFFVPQKSRIVPGALFGAAHQDFDRTDPNKTFTGVTYTLDISNTHKGWDHLMGIYYLKDFGEVNPRFTETRGIVKSKVAPGRYQFLFHFHHFFESISQSDFEATLFNHPDENDIYFYIRAYLINPDNPRAPKGIINLWDIAQNLKGFPIGDPALLSTDKPFIEN